MQGDNCIDNEMKKKNVLLIKNIHKYYSLQTSQNSMLRKYSKIMTYSVFNEYDQSDLGIFMEYDQSDLGIFMEYGQSDLAFMWSTASLTWHIYGIRPI